MRHRPGEVARITNAFIGQDYLRRHPMCVQYVFGKGYRTPGLAPAQPMALVQNVTHQYPAALRALGTSVILVILVILWMYQEFPEML